MERLEAQENNFEEVPKMEHIIKQDPKFYDKFKAEWEEITATLRQIHEASKLKKERNEEQNKIYRPTSSSVIFK